MRQFQQEREILRAVAALLFQVLQQFLGHLREQRRVRAVGTEIVPHQPVPHGVVADLAQHGVTARQE
ncbi:hypothetical protein D3C83_70180 [compost metagenome]